MENWSFFLFSGTNFGKKKFARVLDCFKDKKETDSKVENLPLFDNGSLEPEELAVSSKRESERKLLQCPSFGTSDEQFLEAAWCLTNVAVGKPEETKAPLPALPLVIAHLGEKSSLTISEQCVWHWEM
ncbi:hypothetical protein SLA2020_239220 [Shorea laevis]